METLIIEATPKSPYIYCDAKKGIVEMSGRGLLENTPEFMKPVLDWFNKFQQPHNITPLQVNCRFEYYNTSFSKELLTIFRILADVYQMGVKITINWYWEEEDTDMLGDGENFCRIAQIPFNYYMVVKN